MTFYLSNSNFLKSPSKVWGSTNFLCPYTWDVNHSSTFCCVHFTGYSLLLNCPLSTIGLCALLVETDGLNCDFSSPPAGVFCRRAVFRQCGKSGRVFGGCFGILGEYEKSLDLVWRIGYNVETNAKFPKNSFWGIYV